MRAIRVKGRGAGDGPAQGAQAQLPDEVELHYCPACGRRLSGSTYTVDETRSRCTKTVHREMAVGALYRLVEPL